MKTLNTKHILQMEVLTPLHVGAGSEKDWIKGIDFVIDDNKIKTLNLNKVIKYVNVDELSRALINKNSNALIAKIGKDNLEKCIDKTFDCNYSGSNNIKTCIKNGLTNKPIVPGSSLKGSVRSVLFKHLKGVKNEQEKEIFGDTNKGDEFMRFVKISDFTFEKTILINTKLFNLRQVDNGFSGGWKHTPKPKDRRPSTTDKFNNKGFNTIYEVLPPKTKGYGSLMFAHKAFENFGKQKQKYGNKKAKILEISNLFKIINKHTKEHLTKQLNFFKKYRAEKSELIIDSIKNLLDLIPDDNSYCLINMAAGSGFHSITGDWQFDDYTIDAIHRRRGSFKRRNSAKSRKIAILNSKEFSLMGFVKISLLTEEEIRKYEAKKQEKREAEEQKREELRKLEEELRKLEEEQRKIKEEKEKIQNNYNTLIQSALNLYNQEKLVDSLTNFKEAESILPEGDIHTKYIAEIEKKIERMKEQEEYRQRKAEEKIEAAERRKQQIQEGLAFLDEKYDDDRYKVTNFKGVTDRVDRWLKRANHTELPAEEHETLIRNLERIYSSANKREQKQWQHFENRVWNNIIKWIGKEKAEELFNKLIK